jgi:hypothetical protein
MLNLFTFVTLYNLFTFVTLYNLFTFVTLYNLYFDDLTPFASTIALPIYLFWTTYISVLDYLYICFGHYLIRN